MRSKILADLVLSIHFLYILAVIIPAVLIPIGARLKWSWVLSRKLRVIHLAMISIVLIEILIGMTCPLTWLENQLLEASGANSYQESFITHWMNQLMYWPLPTWIFTIGYFLFFAWIVFLWRAYSPR